MGSVGIYEPFINGGHFKNNPSINRELCWSRMYKRIMSEMCEPVLLDRAPGYCGPPLLGGDLMYDGLAVFYFDEEFDRFMALRATGLGQVNMYDNPTNFTVYGNQVFSRLWTPATAFRSGPNYLREPVGTSSTSTRRGWRRSTVPLR